MDGKETIIPDVDEEESTIPDVDEEESTVPDTNSICALFPMSPMAHTLMINLRERGCKYAKTQGGADAIPEKSEAESGGSDASTELIEFLDRPVNDIDGPRIELPVKQGAMFLFGTSQRDCDIVLDKARQVSRRHFRIFLRSNGVLMLQNLSPNGTFVGAVRVDEQCALFGGDTITVRGVKSHIKFLVQTLDLPDTPRIDHQIQDYTISKCLGTGAYGTVDLAVQKNTGALFAIKTVQIKNRVEDSLREAKVLQRLNHENIVRYSDSFRNEEKLYIVMEYIGGGNLSLYIKERGRMCEDMVQETSRQVLRAIAYMHSMDIVHRDLKPENILISSHQPLLIKISDFGLARTIQAQASVQNTFCGTRLYLAPEVYPTYNTAVAAGGGSSKRKRSPNEDDGPENAKLTQRYYKAIDIWSFGCLTHMLLTCKPAFEAQHDDDMMLQFIMKGYNNTAHLDGVLAPDNLPDARDFLKELLRVDPLQRITPDAALKHVWLQRHQETGGELVLPMPGGWPL